MCTLIFAKNRVCLQRRVFGLNSKGKLQVAQCVFVGATYTGVPGQCSKLVERSQHLCRSAFKQPPATAGKKRITTKKQWGSVHVCAVKRNMTRRVTWDVHDLESKPQTADFIASTQTHQRFRNVFTGRTIDNRSSGISKFIQSADMVSMMVGD